KRPPILAVLTHIDLLSPAMEWAPSYDWQQPKRPKEQQIQQAVAAVREQLGEFLVGMVPVCVAPGKGYGGEEWLPPAAGGPAPAGSTRSMLSRCCAASRPRWTRSRCARSSTSCSRWARKR